MSIQVVFGEDTFIVPDYEELEYLLHSKPRRVLHLLGLLYYSTGGYIYCGKRHEGMWLFFRIPEHSSPTFLSHLAYMESSSKVLFFERELSGWVCIYKGEHLPTLIVPIKKGAFGIEDL